MNATSVFVVTFVLWLVAKGRVADYVALVSNSGSGAGASSSAPVSPSVPSAPAAPAVPALPTLGKRNADGSISIGL